MQTEPGENGGGRGIRTPDTLSGIAVFKLSRLAGVSEAGDRRRNPERSRRNPGANGGGRGIRTPDTLSGIAVFKTACFNRSHIPPYLKMQPWFQFTSAHSLDRLIDPARLNPLPKGMIQ